MTPPTATGATPRIMAVYGTRPEAIKLAPVITALQDDDALEVVPVVTGQHRHMLDQVNATFGIAPAHDLDVFEAGMGLHRLLEKTVSALAPVLADERPDAVLVQGDTTSAFAAGLAAYYAGIPVLHLEAGLRTASISSPFPEEGNRRLLTQITGLHLAPTPAARDNLLASGVAPADIVVTGNTVIDALQATVAAGTAPTDPLLGALTEETRRIALVTSHRRESWGAPMRRTAAALRTLAERRNDLLLVFPLHANPDVRGVFEAALRDLPNVLLTDSLTYVDLCAVLDACALVITDSGGLQEEAPALGKPVLVLRDDTERPEAVEAGTAVLVGTDTDRILSTAERLLDDPEAYATMAKARNPFGDGRAAARTVAAVRAFFGLGERLPDFSPAAQGSA